MAEPRPARRGLPRVPQPGGDPAPSAGAAAATQAPDVVAAEGVPVRRGLPRVVGGEPWPPAGTVSPARVLPGDAMSPASEDVALDIPERPAPERPAPERRSRRPLPAWAGRAGIAAAAAVILLGVLVLLARWLVGTEAGQRFLTAYPGTYPLPEGAPVGIPAWLAWQHLFNVFLLVLIVRTGLEVRRQTRPAASWAPRSDPRARIGLMAWAHQALDVLWVANGVGYIVLLFATGQWVRIVPTSWSVFPDALSAGLQYLSLSWPTEDGWVHYNSLQQLTYFVTVFVAAPLSVASGVRMSVYWRSRPAWDRVLPIAAARKVHFPVMLYFVAFVVLHVALVLATGAQRNLNHMFAARDDASWIGFGLFLVSLVVIVGAAFALRPVVVAPVARRLGTVSGR